MMKNPHSVQPKKPLIGPAQADAHWRTEIGADRRQTRIPPAQPYREPAWRKDMRRRVAKLRQRARAEDETERQAYRWDLARYPVITPQETARMMRNFQRAEEGMTLQTLTILERGNVHRVIQRLRLLTDRGLIEKRIVFDGQSYVETWFLKPPPQLAIVSRGSAPLDAPWPRSTPPTEPAA
jgi:hypothetical protein